jgi:catechol 2,3-dioxygenase-like lactoylglutathione lyase family enzyme
MISALASHVEMKMTGAIDHIVLNVEDVERMVKFYREVMKLPAERLDEYRAGRVPFPSVRINDDSIIDLFPREMWSKSDTRPKGRPNLNHFCLAMDNGEWEELRGRLSEYQVPIDEGPVPRWGAHGTGTSFYFRDPEGNMIEARYYEDGGTSKGCLLSS